MVNRAAARGRARSLAASAVDAYRAAAIDVELHEPASAEDAASRMSGLAAAGAERVVVVGGDGMVHLAANAFANTDTTIGIVAGGTGNDSARGLGLPLDMTAACAASLGEGVPVDLIEGPAGYAVTSATIGYSVAVNKRADVLRFPKGSARYTIASLIEMPRLKVHPLTLTLDGVQRQCEVTLLVVANLAMFGGGMKIAPDADCTDGLLDVIAVGPAGKLRFATLLPTVFSGGHVRSKHVDTYRATRVDIAGEALSVRADGDPFGTAPLTLTARPRSLRVASAR